MHDALLARSDSKWICNTEGEQKYLHTLYKRELMLEKSYDRNNKLRSYDMLVFIYIINIKK